MERLDVFLVNNGYFQSREKANQAIKKGLIEVDGKVINKPAFNVNTENKIVVLDVMLKYVSWGGMKLERAINYFNLDFKDKVVLDCFSNVGGFALHACKYGAKHVDACDISKKACDDILVNAKLNGFEQLNVICDDTFNLLRQESLKDKYDVIVLDPPAFTKDKSTVKKAYRGYKAFLIGE